jgi:hypothetical protein
MGVRAVGGLVGGLNGVWFGEDASDESLVEARYVVPLSVVRLHLRDQRLGVAAVGELAALETDVQGSLQQQGPSQKISIIFEHIVLINPQSIGSSLSK